MYKFVTTAVVLSSLSANADVLSSTQRFLGLGGQSPEYVQEQEGETPVSVIDQAPYSPADSDLGVQEILVPRPDRAPVIFNANTAILRTDNAPSSTGNDGSSWVSASSLAVAWRPHVYRGWFADLGVGGDIIRYDRSDSIDYENFSLRLGTFKVIPDLDDLVIFSRFEYQRITSSSVSDGDYNAQRIRAGLQKVLWAAPRHQLTSGLSGAYEWSAHPETLRRNEIGGDIAYRYSITDSMYTLAAARAFRFNYDDFGREDWSYGFALELVNRFSENLTLTASIFYDKNDTNIFAAFNEYDAWSGGLGLSAQWTF